MMDGGGGSTLNWVEEELALTVVVVVDEVRLVVVDEIDEVEEVPVNVVV